MAVVAAAVDVAGQTIDGSLQRTTIAVVAVAAVAVAEGRTG